MDQDRERPARIVQPGSGGAVGLLRSALPSTTGSTASRWLGLETSVSAISPAAVVRKALGTQVVLDVTGASLWITDHRFERALSLELAQDLLIRLANAYEPARSGAPGEPCR